MLIDDNVLDELLDKAAASPRLRMNLDMRTSPDDSSQRMLNALLPGTVLPIHRHTESTEVVTILRGRLIAIFYDNNGTETERILLDPREGKYALSIPVGQWHTVVPLEKSVIFEAKDKPFIEAGRYAGSNRGTQVAVINNNNYHNEALLSDIGTSE